ncbi:interferon alpha-inducible protein 27-like protein 2A [Erpetoichthys calabaricus]|uniref:interferon alpha-inducible protein 27-like protein 2A n=1 Tax=Erpetoichthys calabaricus TaxID=27687 RepID=UPI00109F4CFD|nr:interferon alpha-inducible protein 27-like protein 2A [Erpetoichthys calabaricus]
MGLLTAAAFAALTAAGAPVLLGAIGFTTAGIAAGSIAAKMMSAAAIANGGGVVAGGVIATLQSLGTGIGISGTILSGAAGGAIGALI